MSDKKLVRGVGVYERGKYVSWVDGKQTREHALWISMLERCYSPKWQEKFPTYVGCTASSNFKSFQFFAEWCNGQVGFRKEGYQLDKDILDRGNKQYNEALCVFVPRELNMVVTNSRATRGLYPVGVHWSTRGKKFKATLGVSGKMKHLGCYDTVEEAFTAYKGAKESLIKGMAEKYKSSLDIRVYRALMVWEVDIDD